MSLYLYRKFCLVLTLSTLLAGWAAAAPNVCTSGILLNVAQVPADTTNQVARDLNAVKKRTERALEQTRKDLSRYQPGGKTNPLTLRLLRVVSYFMAAFVACTFLMLILIVVNRIRRGQAARRYATVKQKYEDILVNLLYSQESEPEEDYRLKPSEELRAENEAELNDIMATDVPASNASNSSSTPRMANVFSTQELKRRFHRRVLVEQILDLHKNLSGSTANILRELYLELGFDKDALNRLERRSWSKKAQAIRELAQMEIAEAEPAIAALLNHSNPVLVSEVQIALLKLNREHPFSFLDETEVVITDWQQVSLLAMISHSPHFHIPAFSQWFRSPNDSVVLFAIKMMNYYSQLDASGELIQLLTHPNEKVRLEAIATLGQLEVNEADGPLMEAYADASEEQQMAILTALGKIGTERAFAFLKTALESPRFPLVFQAAKGLMRVGQPGVEALQLAEQSDSNLQRIVKHLKDERI